MQYTSIKIRQKFLNFFKSKNHAIIPSAPLVPENDPTALFNVAGMQPIVPYLLGEKHPSGTRLADSQKCLRTNDIEEVGDNSHLSFFEMLGNWSLGDYFKKESIAWSYEFLTSSDWLGLDPRMIAVTVFEGDENSPIDEESAKLWNEVGIPKNKISYLNKKENWWGPAGETGPCGPDSEIFYWVGESEFPPENSNVENDENNWMEIWNNVFMEYIKTKDGKYIKAEQQNVDTGMGLERIVTVLNGEKTVYNTDVFEKIIAKIEEILGVKYRDETMNSIRIIADHLRVAVMLISDGVVPSNIEQGYILRRLMRRAIRQAFKLGHKESFMPEIAKVIIEHFTDIYPNVKEQEKTILEEIQREEKQFSETLEKGLKEFEKLLEKKANLGIEMGNIPKFNNTINGIEAFKLYDTFGFPLEMTVELAEEKGLKVDEEGFKKAFEKHQELSRVGSAQKFKGGLADNSEATTALHSATHLMLAGLNEVLGGGIDQKGSNITAERLRFDFNFDRKVTREELDKVEEYVNNTISKACEVELREMDKTEAKESGVRGSFWEKYPEVVKVYTFKDSENNIYSKELCGGPHVENTKTMGTFKIKKEEASSRGIRRIKAVLVKD